jgi:hypothetical protein
VLPWLAHIQIHHDRIWPSSIWARGVNSQMVHLPLPPPLLLLLLLLQDCCLTGCPCCPCYCLQHKA